MTDIPPRLIELIDQLIEAVRRASAKHDTLAASSPAQPPGLLIPPPSKVEQEKLHTELEHQIETEFTLHPTTLR